MSGDFWSSGESDSATNNGTCFEENLNFSLSPAYNIDTIMKYHQMVNFLIVFFLGVLLNIFVLVLLLKFKKLRTLSFALALQIVFINLVNSLLFATDLISSIANRWLFGCEHICVLVGLLHSFHLFEISPKDSVYLVSYSMAFGVCNSNFYASRIV